MTRTELQQNAQLLFEEAPCKVELPAGCGKTELVAATGVVAQQRRQRLLVLTHTHAGVDALRRRLQRMHVSPATVHVSTLDGWSSRLVRHYPILSDHVVPETVDWPALRAAATHALESRHLREVVAASYDLVVVDEYQDCSVDQHAVVTSLARLLPVVILGDPLQAIYGFGADTVVDWVRDLADWPDVAFGAEPWRWAEVNPALGRFLFDVRNRLQTGRPVDLRNAPLNWVKDSADARRIAGWSAKGYKGSVVLLEGHDITCEALARQLGGHFDVMEPLDGGRLLSLAKIIDEGDGPAGAAAVVVFACASHAKLPQGLKQKGEKMRAGSFPAYKRDSKLGPLLDALSGLAIRPAPESLTAVFDAIENEGATRFRKEAWRDMRRAIRLWATDRELYTLTSAVKAVRDQARFRGRGTLTRAVSRTVLVKGLEFDHCVVMRAHELSRCDLYVALTRARHSLTVLSSSPILQPTK